MHPKNKQRMHEIFPVSYEPRSHAFLKAYLKLAVRSLGGDRGASGQWTGSGMKAAGRAA